MIKNFKYALCALCVICSLWSCSDNEDDIAINYYSATKSTAAGFLDERPDEFSEFTAILKKSDMYSLLSTYGKFTVFAPNNAAIDQYLKQNGYSSVDELPLERCDTLSRIHIIKQGDFYTTDYGDATLPSLNMVNGYIYFSSESDVANNNALTYYVNKNSRMIERDDSVTNGVVHIIDKVITPSSDLLPDLIDTDPNLTLFSQALKVTCMADSLRRYIDETYSVGLDSTIEGNKGGKQLKCQSGGDAYTHCYWPSIRYFKYTVLAETDSVFKAHGIETLEDLTAYAKSVYDATYPEDAGLHDNDPTDRKNPLNRFVSYHLMPRYAEYSQFIATQADKCWDTNLCDPETFYETMCPGTMLRVAKNTNGLFINNKRVGTRSVTYPIKGSRIFNPQESKAINPNSQQAVNGVYHYLYDLIGYTTQVRDDVLNCRIRIDATRLSPDFMNQNAVGEKFARHGVGELTGFKRGFLTDWEFTEQTIVSVHSDVDYWNSFDANAVCVNGIFDVAFRLPPVPEGTYEIRLGYTASPERGVVQVYFNGEACGQPVDLRKYTGDPTIGFQPDVTERENIDQRVEEDIVNDKSYHNRGFMKSPACWKIGGGDPMRSNPNGNSMRRVLTTQQLHPNQVNKLRFRQVLDNGECYWTFDYIELCPKSIYAGAEPEDPF